MTSQIDTLNDILREWGYDKVIPPGGNSSVGVDNEGNITYIYISYNFKGNIPNSFYTFTSLTILTLVGTSLTGKVSSKIQNFKELYYINMSNNNTLTFNISYLKSLNKLTFVEIGNTNCIGDLADLSNLTLLTHLSLGYTINPNIKGDIKDIKLLKKLNFLNLSDCNITGNISNILNLPNLSYIDLRYNNLFGDIPDISNVFGSPYIYLSYNCLTLTQDIADKISKLDVYKSNHINFDYNCIKNINNFKGISNLNCSGCTSCGNCKPPTINDISISSNTLNITYSFPSD